MYLPGTAIIIRIVIEYIIFADSKMIIILADVRKFFTQIRFEDFFVIEIIPFLFPGMNESEIFICENQRIIL